MPTPTIDDYKQEALNALAKMTPAERARQQFANTLTNFGNTVTFGGLGALGDLARGTPVGTTAEQIGAQLDAQAAGARAVSTGLGLVAPVGAARAALTAAGGTRAAAGAVARFFAPAEQLGARAAALGARAELPVGRTIAKFALPAAGAGALYGAAERAQGQTASPPPPAPLAPPPPDPIKDALAQGRDAAKADPQGDLATALSAVLGRNPSISDLQSIGALVPAAVKPTGTQRDFIFGQAYAQSKALAESQIADLQAQLSAGKITQDQARAGVQQVLQTHFNQTAGLVGFDPAKLALAAELSPDTNQ